jgi:transcriptional regulator with XRE-family HTH domain
MSPIQCRAGRALIGMTVDALAAASGVSRATIMRYENAGGDVLLSNLKKMQAALEGQGIRFIDDDEGEGVKLRKK